MSQIILFHISYISSKKLNLKNLSVCILTTQFNLFSFIMITDGFGFFPYHFNFLSSFPSLFPLSFLLLGWSSF